MVHRLMDLVVLMAELSQKRNKSVNELDEELLHEGYSAEEIEQAVFWFTARVRPIDRGGIHDLQGEGIRVLSPLESMCVDGEAHGYLLRLLNLGIVDAAAFEEIMNRLTTYVSQRLQLVDVKALAGSVIFNMGLDEIDEDLLRAADDEIPVT